FLQAQASELSSNGTAAFRYVEDPEAEAPKNASPLVMTIKNNVVAIGMSGAVKRFASDDHDFEHSYFHQVISQSYQSGAGWLFCANLEQILRNTVLKKEDDEKNPSGLQDVRYLIFERKDMGGRTDNRVALNFRGERRGFSSWLGAPGPMGGLDFVSPNALVAASFVLRNPHALLGELFSYFEGQNSNFAQQLSDFESRSG